MPKHRSLGALYHEREVVEINHYANGVLTQVFDERPHMFGEDERAHPDAEIEFVCAQFHHLVKVEHGVELCYDAARSAALQDFGS